MYENEDSVTQKLLSIINCRPADTKSIWVMFDEECTQDDMTAWLRQLQGSGLVFQLLQGSTPKWTLTTAGEVVHLQNQVVIDTMVSFGLSCSTYAILYSLNMRHGPGSFGLTQAGLLTCLLRLERDGYIQWNDDEYVWELLVFTDMVSA